MAQRSRKIDTTDDSGGDRRRPNPDRVEAREEMVTGHRSDGDRSAGRKAGAEKPIRGTRDTGSAGAADG